MKKWILLTIAALFTLTLSGCDTVYIEPDVIAVQFENVRYEDDSIIVDVWITNGTATDFELGYIEFWLQLPEELINTVSEEEQEVCGAGFDFYITIPDNDYVMYEIEFTSDYIFVSETRLSELGVTLEDLEFFYWFEE